MTRDTALWRAPWSVSHVFQEGAMYRNPLSHYISVCIREEYLNWIAANIISSLLLLEAMDQVWFYWNAVGKVTSMIPVFVPKTLKKEITLWVWLSDGFTTQSEGGLPLDRLKWIKGALVHLFTSFLFSFSEKIKRWKDKRKRKRKTGWWRKWKFENF